MRRKQPIYLNIHSIMEMLFNTCCLLLKPCKEDDPFSKGKFFNFGIFTGASKPRISGNLEKSGNFVALEKCLGKVREFREIRRRQGILTWNWEKSGNFTCAKWLSLKFFQNLFKCWTRISHACSYIMHAHGFLSKNKN